jgi:hypothetical protein
MYVNWSNLETAYVKLTPDQNEKVIGLCVFSLTPGRRDAVPTQEVKVGNQQSSL